MTTGPRLERDLPLILGDLAAGPYPAYIDDVLATTGRRRQRPAWIFLAWWLPVEPIRDRVRTSGVPWRAMATVALVGLLIATAVAVYVGTRRQRLPEPFGLAASCGVAVADAGSLAVVDPDDAKRSEEAVFSGADPSLGLDGLLSPDGMKVAVVHGASAATERIEVVPVAGGPPVPIGGGPFTSIVSVEWSPQSDSLAITSRVDDGTGRLVGRLTLVDADGSGAQVIDPGFEVSTVVFRPPDGREMLVRSYGRDGVGLHVLDRYGGLLRTLIPRTPTADPGSDLTAAYSPDGRSLAYHRWDPVTQTYKLFVGSADDPATAAEVLAAPDVWYVGEPAWSNGGDRIAFQVRHRDTGDGDATRMAILDVAAGQIVEAGPSVPDDTVAAWSPDDRQILLFSAEDGAVPLLLDPLGGTVEPAPWGGRNYPSWRRCAT